MAQPELEIVLCQQEENGSQIKGEPIRFTERYTVRQINGPKLVPGDLYLVMPDRTLLRIGSSYER